MKRSTLYHFWPYFLSALTMAGVWLGGWFSSIGILIIFIVHPLLDHFLTRLLGDQKAPVENASDFSLYLWPAYQTLYIFCGIYFLKNESSLLHFILGCVSIGIITGGFGITIAHELVHRPIKWQRGLGVWALALVNYAAFRIEHVHGHHRNVATPEDPASAQRGENIYFFIPKAIIGVIRGAKKIEDIRISRLQTSALNKLFLHRINQYFFYSMALTLIFYALFGFYGVFFFLVQSIVAISLLEMVDFIEHYGLERKKLSTGKYEPVGPWHSWDTNFFMTNTSLYNLGKHAHHHQIASLSYQNLTNTPGAYNYPFGYSTAVLIALIPPLWRKIVDPLLPS